MNAARTSLHSCSNASTKSSWPRNSRYHDIAACQQLHSGHLQGDPTSQTPGLGGMVEPATQHRPNDIDVQTKRQGCSWT
jgi:hypothetical protein